MQQRLVIMIWRIQQNEVHTIIVHFALLIGLAEMLLKANRTGVNIALLSSNMVLERDGVISPLHQVYVNSNAHSTSEAPRIVATSQFRRGTFITPHVIKELKHGNQTLRIGIMG